MSPELDRYLTKLQTFFHMGRLLASLSTCKRKQVAAIVFPVDCSRVYAIGYNGPPRGMPNDSCCSEQGNCGCVHAETNAVSKFNDDVAMPSLLFCTTAPCGRCAGLILNKPKIVGVVYDEDYRVYDGVNLINLAGMRAVRADKINETHLIAWHSLIGH